MNFVGATKLADKYDFIVIGSGFGSFFFLRKILEKSDPNVRVIVLERGHHLTHAEQIALHSNRAAEQDKERSAEPTDYVSIPAGHKP